LLLGNLATQHPAYADLCALAQLIAEKTGATLGYLPEAANTAGAWLAGFVPHRQAAAQTAQTVGKSAQEILTDSTKTFVLLGLEAEFDTDNPQKSIQALAQADNVIAINSYVNPRLKEYATVLLPASQTVETSGTFVNMEGRLQSFKGVSKLLGDARPTWKILRVLGNLLNVDGFDYMSSEDVRNELKVKLEQTHAYQAEAFFEAKPMDIVSSTSEQSFQRIGTVQMYSGDSLLRRATALQQAAGDERRIVTLHPDDIARLDLGDEQTVSVAQGDSSVQMSLVADSAIPIHSALLPSATQKSGFSIWNDSNYKGVVK